MTGKEDDRDLLIVTILCVLFVGGLLVFSIVRDQNAFEEYESNTTTITDKEED